MSKEFLQRTMIPTASTKVDTGVITKPVNKETLSCFDSTTYKSSTRVGQHPKNTETTNADAFSNHITTMRLNPHQYLTKGQGMGGTSNVAAALHAKEVAANRAHQVSPPKANAKGLRPNPPNTALRLHYERGDIPAIVGDRSTLTWKADITKLDYAHYLPILCSGLREIEEPFRLITDRGIQDMLNAPGAAEKVAVVIPQLVIPIKEALSTRIESVLIRCCQVLSSIARLGSGCGPALVPYFRQLLPVINIFAGRSVNLGDAMDFAQRKGHIGELIQDTLQTLERYGGPDAYINIKYMVPTYESCMLI